MENKHCYRYQYMLLIIALGVTALASWLGTGQTEAVMLLQVLSITTLALLATYTVLFRMLRRSYSYSGIRLRAQRLTLPKHPVESPVSRYTDRPDQRRQKSHTRHLAGYGFGVLGRMAVMTIIKN